MAVALSEIIKESVKRAGLTETFANEFFERLSGHEAIRDEYVYYLRTGSFQGKYKAAGLSVSDVLVYQIDHFKAWMDQDRLGMKFNPDEMILKAFDTLMKMDEDETYAQAFRNRMMSESGTDGTERETGCNY